jgi:hypothetical protein
MTPTRPATHHAHGTWRDHPMTSKTTPTPTLHPPQDVQLEAPWWTMHVVAVGGRLLAWSIVITTEAAWQDNAMITSGNSTSGCA